MIDLMKLANELKRRFNINELRTLAFYTDYELYKELPNYCTLSELTQIIITWCETKNKLNDLIVGAKTQNQAFNL